MGKSSIEQSSYPGKWQPHYILCDPDKRPINALGWDSKGWQHNPASPEQARQWHSEGGLVGVIPASLGILVVDVDKCPEGKSIADLSAMLDFPHEYTKSQNHDGGHILVRWDGEPRSNDKWEWQGYSGDTRHAKGYAIMWDRRDWKAADKLEPIRELPMLNARTKPAAAQNKPVEGAGDNKFMHIGQPSYIFVERYIEKLGIELLYNEVAQRIEWYCGDELERYNDHFESWLRERIEMDCGVPNAKGETRRMRLSDSKWATILKALLSERGYNPHIDWVESLPEPAPDTNLLETALLDSDTFAADDTPLNREWLKLLMVGMYMRIVQPGAHYRYMPILRGEQNIGKSTFLRLLVPYPEWFSETLELNASVKEQEEGLRGKLLTECSELSGMRRAAIEKLKSTITRTQYSGRLPYGKSPVDIPRAGIIAGTTNADMPLPQDGGNTRFVVLHCNRRWVDIAGWMAVNRDQLWAEAKALYESGYRPYLDPALEVEQSIVNADLAYRNESLEARLMDFILSDERRYAIEKDGLAIAEFLEYATFNKLGLGRLHNNAVADALRAAPFRFDSRQMSVNGRRGRRWLAPDGWFESYPAPAF